MTISDMSEDYFESFCNRMRKLKVEVQRISSANARLMGERLITASDNDLMRVIRGEINYDIDRDILRSYLHGSACWSPVRAVRLVRSCAVRLASLALRLS